MPTPYRWLSGFASARSADQAARQRAGELVVGDRLHAADEDGAVALTLLDESPAARPFCRRELRRSGVEVGSAAIQVRVVGTTWAAWTYAGAWDVDSTGARAAGLVTRPLWETVSDTWDWLNSDSSGVAHERASEQA